VSILLRGAGYELYDLGIDVPTEKIVDFVRDEKPDYVGLSALLTTTMLEMKEIIEALKKNKLKDSTKVLIGGAAVSDEYAKEIEADAYCVDGFHAIKILDEFEKSRA
jgi:5-methyltetrahydrofolate--homocysteine methyltransferase